MIKDSNNIMKDKAIVLFVVISAFVGLSFALSEQLFANYFKEAYDIGAFQRGFIEFPRELPGIISLFVIAAITFLGDIRMAIISQFISAGAILLLGIWRPDFYIMCVILFCYSLGQHMYLVLGDSIGLSLAEKGHMGRVIGRFNGVKTALLMVGGVVTFLGFKFGIFDFEIPILVYILSAVAFAAAGVLLISLYKMTYSEKKKSNVNAKLVFRKDYLRYYLYCALYGGRKQIMIVFSPWVLIDLLGFRADTMSILSVIGFGIGIFFIPAVGRMIDRLGVKKVMYIEAGAFIAVYTAYGLLSKYVNENVVVLTGVAMLLVYFLNIIDKMSNQFSMVRSIYIRKIAVTPEDVTPSLSMGMAIDHIVAIVGAYLCGIVWEAWGPEYVFLIAGVLSLGNMIVAAGIKNIQ
ncbi:MAG: MFS transporter [Clostridiales Family XIII bacterium]|jgi:predicted MFS family arabinose efflux permease|nr:MFS transporter [Clostridiales Family XIII bacterium]